MSDAAHRVSDRIGSGSVSVTRVAPRVYQGMNERGATVRIGGSELEGEHFTPGELLKLALIACTGLSADIVTARRLGDDFDVTIWAHGRSDAETNRYYRIEEEVLLDLASLGADERERLVQTITRAVDRGCTVARSIGDSVDLALEVRDPADD
ncbi:OsmC family peroxiredoxin [Agromyces sp. CFH 90414]|uniref:OsmC family peroxiredoxin n=1 Tax=Agromyces agglutinans TaxID=2662258 RepID=A0A6I2FL25_9MICO|nr:OsmC family protein [Agromyces agglutinans]MRG61328.1 OsmC family peroxiredoxin [Agromyces agglutinans]